MLKSQILLKNNILNWNTLQIQLMRCLQLAINLTAREILANCLQVHYKVSSLIS